MAPIYSFASDEPVRNGVPDGLGAVAHAGLRDPIVHRSKPTVQDRRRPKTELWCLHLRRPLRHAAW
jgi:hypothetical protein